MSCLDRIKVNLVTHEIFKNTTRLYLEMGKNPLYEQIFNDNIEYIKKDIANKNAEHFYKLFFASDFSLRENRYRSLLLDSSVANNRSEQLYKNIVEIFNRIHVADVEQFNLDLGEINDLFTLMFNGVLSKEQLKYRKFGKKKGMFLSETKSMREELEKYLIQINSIAKERSIEPIFLYLNFMVDFMNMQIFDMPYNESLAILIFYILMVENHYQAANYLSFFQKLNYYKIDYEDILNKIKIQSAQGLPDLMPLMSFLINIFNGIYFELEEISRNHQFDQNLEISKTDYVENTINKLPEVFSKEDIRVKHPSISESTINRTLKRLSDENIIRALGVGRNAKWVKIAKKQSKHKFEGQMNLDLGE
ncbi:MAG: hypothetical protein PHF05_03455 [Candidatus Izemoplasmatales bacterium]|nr:hypothetical protein [Candidatus Izemoplasmatales bacterium]MDD4069488.1 hypothetical protein [Candidatus Izemoplasmatales bacterium]MDY0139244.1 hypothetical protein [Candidatus Izemoplasmatales bacterium]